MVDRYYRTPTHQTQTTTGSRQAMAGGPINKAKGQNTKQKHSKQQAKDTKIFGAWQGSCRGTLGPHRIQSATCLATRSPVPQSRQSRCFLPQPPSFPASFSLFSRLVPLLCCAPFALCMTLDKSNRFPSVASPLLRPAYSVRYQLV